MEEYLRVVRQQRGGTHQFLARQVIVTQAVIIKHRLGEMGFPQIGRKIECLLRGRLCFGQPGGRVIEVKPIEVKIRARRPAISEGKITVARNCFVEQAEGFQQRLLRIRRSG